MWIAAISVWHMTVQYYMKKCSWYVNINHNIYVLTLKESTSDIEKPQQYILKSKMTV